MLLGSVIVLVVAGKLASGMTKELPRPQPVLERGEWQVKEAKQARWGVVGSLAVLVAGMLLVGMTRWVSFVQGGDGGSPYASAEERQQQWPRFRGPGGAGISAYTNIPTSWNGKTGEGIAWKTPVPLKGHNSPVVWGDRVFLSGADPNVRQVYCFDGKSGQLLWTGDVPTAPLPAGEKFEIKEDTGYACPDGRHRWPAGLRDVPHGRRGRLRFQRQAAVAQEPGPAGQCLRLRLVAGDLAEARAHRLRPERRQGRQIAVLRPGWGHRPGRLGGQARICRARGRPRSWWTWRGSRS